MAEKAAWEFAEKNGLDVVAIHPATCLGPLLQPSLNASCAVLQQLLQGSTDTQEYHWLGAVHVKDVAKAQLLLFETPTASGRYLCTNGIYQFGDFADRVSKLFPEFPVHRFVTMSSLQYPLLTIRVLWLPFLYIWAGLLHKVMTFISLMTGIACMLIFVKGTCPEVTSFCI